MTFFAQDDTRIASSNPGVSNPRVAGPSPAAPTTSYQVLGPQAFALVDDLALLGFNAVELVISGKPQRAKIDLADLPKVLAVSTRWSAQYCSDSRTFYASAKRKKAPLHRVVMDNPLPCFHVDHKNHDGLDNRSANLRVVTPAQNSANTRHRLGVAGFRNVNIVRGQYRASVMVNGKRHVLGLFPTAEEAGKVAAEFRDKAGLL